VIYLTLRLEPAAAAAALALREERDTGLTQAVRVIHVHIYKFYITNIFK